MIARKILVLFFLFLNAACFSQENRQPIRDLLPINGDTVIAVTLSKGCIITYNAGKSWASIIPDKYFNMMTIDNKGVIWAINSWEGIHEEDHSMLYRSADKGKTWQETIFDTRQFFPLKIISQPYQPFRISTQDKKEYLMNGNNLLTDWKYVGIHKETTTADAIIENNYKLLKGGKHYGKLLRRSAKWDTVFHFKYLNAYDMYIKNNTVYVAGFTSGLKGKGYFASLANNKLREYPVAGHVYGIKEDNKGRLWIYASEGIYLLKTTNEFVKVY